MPDVLSEPRSMRLPSGA